MITVHKSTIVKIKILVGSAFAVGYFQVFLLAVLIYFSESSKISRTIFTYSFIGGIFCSTALTGWMLVHQYLRKKHNPGVLPASNRVSLLLVLTWGWGAVIYFYFIYIKEIRSST